MFPYRFRSISSRDRILLLLAMLLAWPLASPVRGDWRTLPGDGGECLVRLRTPVQTEIQAERPFFLVTHGMNGADEGDRFYQLAESIAAFLPDANVLLVDWSEASRAQWLGMQIPFAVAGRIDQVANEASDLLCNLGFEPGSATLIGESFGNYVNARIAANFGAVDCMLAMNPASEWGGYPLPDLRRVCRLSWSFHTYSFLDSQRTLAHASILLETPDEFDALEQHTCGIARLTERIQRGKLDWLEPTRELPAGSPESFHLLATIDGQLLKTRRPKLPAEKEEVQAENKPPVTVEPSSSPHAETLVSSTR
jgi:hypothetical protein